MTQDVSVFDFFNLPADWNRERFRWVLENRKILTSEELPLLGANLVLGVTERFDGDGRPAASEDLSKYKVVDPGDIIMNPLGKPHGSIGRSNVRGITSPAYWVLRCDETNYDSRYMHYLLRSEMMINEFQRRSKNLPPNQFDLPWDQFRDFELAFPPIQEQRQISDYLDDQTGRLSELLIQKREIERLLSEASHSEFSTFFGDPFFAMDTNRETRRLGPCLVANDGGVWGDEPGDGGDTPVVRSTEITKRGYWRNLDDVAMRKLSFSDLQSSKLKLGDIVVTKASGSADHIGKSAIVSQEIVDMDACFGNFMQRIRVDKSIYVPEFMHYFLKSFNARSQFNYLGTTSTGLMNISAEVLNNLRVPVLSIETQKQAVAQLKEIELNFGTKLDLVKRSIAKCEEFRTSLITSAVTGSFHTPGGRSLA